MECHGSSMAGHRRSKEGQWKVMGGQWGVLGGQWEVKGWSLEITWRLDAHCQKKWASLGVKFSGKKKNTKCNIDAHCHCHCRRDPRITINCIEFLQVLSFWVFFDFGKKFLKNAEKLLAKVKENSEARIEESTFFAWFEPKHLKNYQCNPS